MFSLDSYNLTLTEDNKYYICLLLLKKNNELYIRPPSNLSYNNLLDNDSYNNFYVHLGHDLIEKGFYLDWAQYSIIIDELLIFVRDELIYPFNRESFIQFIKKRILSPNNKYINFIKKHFDISTIKIDDMITLLDNKHAEDLFTVFLKNDNELTEYIHKFCLDNHMMKPSYLYATVDIGCFTKNINPTIFLKTIIRIALDLEMIVYGELALPITYKNKYLLRLSTSNKVLNVYRFINILNILFQFNANFIVKTYIQHNNRSRDIGYKIFMYFDSLSVEIIITDRYFLKKYEPSITNFSLAIESINGKDHIYSLSKNTTPFEIMKLSESKIIKLNSLNIPITKYDFYVIVELFHTITNYISQGWSFDDLPFNITNYITYNINSSKNILNQKFTKDVASIINDYVGINVLSVKKSCFKNCNIDSRICVFFPCCKSIQCVLHALKDMKNDSVYKNHLYETKKDNFDNFKCFDCYNID